MIVREIASLLLEYSQSFRSVVIVGPRQSGKTTLAKACFPQKAYVSLENPDMLELATKDPRGFLSGFSKGAILDEIQRASNRTQQYFTSREYFADLGWQDRHCGPFDTEFQRS